MLNIRTVGVLYAKHSTTMDGSLSSWVVLSSVQWRVYTMASQDLLVASQLEQEESQASLVLESP